MIRYTTPTNALKVKGLDLGEYDVYVTFTQKPKGSRNETILTVPATNIEFDGEDSDIQITLTQQQTAQFVEGPCSIQVNYIDVNGLRNATKKHTIMVHDNLLKEVLSYGGQQ